MSYFTYLVKLIIEYTSVICNFLTSTNAKKVERIQWKLKAPCYNRFFPHALCSYANASEYVELHTLRDRRNRFNVPTFADGCVFYDSTWVNNQPCNLNLT
jgi:hypothetical protein